MTKTTLPRLNFAGVEFAARRKGNYYEVNTKTALKILAKLLVSQGQATQTAICGMLNPTASRTPVDVARVLEIVQLREMGKLITDCRILDDTLHVWAGNGRNFQLTAN